ncbi:hypothetical protein SERLA73DRAFT_51107 [Serpula lacrymans var. lacrymans S7.3]|uniref:Uncharacterized protein n=1 Tax=Serpula lacrymans var. lacrymans (strain S7.3) TaxID=936435 RepID=F8PSU5_SERL3|nr:hypothetical protein SERLA73DRAFT_51107 [Serpula lacrymans var. lacrymans S7.3]
MPFPNAADLYNTIDATTLGDILWQSFSLLYDGELPKKNTPTWMSKSFKVFSQSPHAIVKNMLSNQGFDGHFDYKPVQHYDANGKWQYQNFMSGEWAWKQADIISQDDNTHGSMFVPIILGSNKTTVSVATGQNKYYLIYISIGNVHNSVRRAYQNVLALLGFLSIPKSKSLI